MRRYAKLPTRLVVSTRGQSATERIVDDRFEWSALAMRFFPEQLLDIRVKCQRGSHVDIMMSLKG